MGALKKTLQKPFLFFEGQQDLRRFQSQVKGIGADFASLVERNAGELGEVYTLYTSTVSTPGMAASLQLSATMLSLCQRLSPTNLLDVGSGFSSYVFRKYAADADHPVTVYSTDNHREWLGKTGEFLREHGVSDDNLVFWDDLRDAELPGFDIVLHDLGNMDARAESIPFVLDLAAPHGLVVFDDTHKRRFGKQVRETLAGRSEALFSLRRLTLDDLGRFAMASVPLEKLQD